MFALKPISRDGVPAALRKAERYRLLNDSSAAESICLDVLEVAPDDQQALVMLLLSITDQFDQALADDAARAQVSAIQMHGNVRGLTAMEALTAVMAATTLHYELPEGVIRVSSARESRPPN